MLDPKKSTASKAPGPSFPFPKNGDVFELLSPLELDYVLVYNNTKTGGGKTLLESGARVRIIPDSSDETVVFEPVRYKELEPRIVSKKTRADLYYHEYFLTVKISVFQQKFRLVDRDIYESRLARTAWRVSLIPALGIPLFIIFGMLAMFDIGNRGRTGLWLLWRGLKYLLVIDAAPIVLYLGFYLSGYTGYYPAIYNNLYSFLPKHGVYFTYHPNGLMCVRQSWSFGQKHGLWTRWNDDGQKKLDYLYDKNHTIKWTKWHTNGQIKCEAVEQGSYSGKWIARHENGKIKEEGNFEKGFFVGQWTYYNKQGQISKVEFFYPGHEYHHTTDYLDGVPLFTYKEYPKKERNDSSAVPSTSTGQKLMLFPVVE